MNSAGNKASGRRGFGRRRSLRTASLFLLWAAPSTEGEGNVPHVDSGVAGETLRGLQRTFGDGEACRGYHLNLNTQDGCTNNGNYPPAWTSPDQTHQMFYDRAEDCCGFFFPNKACEVNNVCEDDDASDNADQEPEDTPETAPTAPASTTGTVSTAPHGGGEACILGYHFAINTEDGCTNDGIYPPQWTSPDQTPPMFYDRAEDCCEFFFKNRACEVYNVCEDENTTMLPSKSPTDVPTDEPTVKPTLNPTMLPTKSPTTDNPTVNPTENPTKKPTLSPSFAPTERPPDTIVSIDIRCKMFIQLPSMSIPQEDSPKWMAFEILLVKVINQGIESPLIQDGMKVSLNKFAGHSFRSRRLLETHDEVDEDGNQDHSLSTAPNRLDFGMTIPVFCNHECQASQGRSGESVFHQLADQFTRYVDENGDFSLNFISLGARMGLFRKSDTATASLKVFNYVTGEVTKVLAPTSSPTAPLPTGTPTNRPTDTPTVFAYRPDQYCSNVALWHPIDDQLSGATCSNSYSYPAMWNTPDNRPRYLFEDALDCCRHNGFVPKCNVQDKCFDGEVTTLTVSGVASDGDAQPKSPTSRPTSTPTNKCYLRKWHYNGVGCTNDETYPSLWDTNAEFGAIFLFDSVEDCCRQNGHNSRCSVVDYCLSTTCAGLYHPTSVDESTCVNDNDHAFGKNPEFLFGSPGDCCEKFYEDKLCLMKTVC